MVIVTGHRGCGTNRIGEKVSDLGEPENTSRSFVRAVELGVDQIELDVHLSSDGQLVVIHDETVDRTTNGRGLVCNYAVKELKDLELAKGERIPTLSEVIAILRGRTILQIELKGLGAEELVVELLKAENMVCDVVLTSFRHEAVKKAKTLEPRLRTGVLFACAPITPSRLGLDAEADNLHPNIGWVTRSMVEDAHRNGLKVYVWNADTSQVAEKMLKLGVDAIGTNRLDITLPIIRQRRS